jgi:hypothetical protein
MDEPVPPRRAKRWWRRLGLREAIVGTVVAVIIGWTGVGDWHPFCGIGGTCAAEGSQRPGARELSPDSPVSVVWSGTGDRVVAHWDALSDPELDHYVVNIVALYPKSFTVDAGYRDGQQLETSRELNPASDAVHRFETNGDPLTLTSNQTWQVCVVGYRATPMGVDVKGYEIQKSEKCSDPFAIPTQP